MFFYKIHWYKNYHFHLILVYQEMLTYHRFVFQMCFSCFISQSLWKYPVVIKVASYSSATLLKLSLFTGIFFKDFDHTNSLILSRITNLKNIYFCRTPSWTTASVHSLNSNEWCILFSPFELLHEIAKSFQINWGIERAKTCGSILFCKDKI